MLTSKVSMSVTATLLLDAVKSLDGKQKAVPLRGVLGWEARHFA